MEQNNTTYYRPEWTCGRYDPMWKAAIFYNLLEGMTSVHDKKHIKNIKWAKSVVVE